VLAELAIGAVNSKTDPVGIRADTKAIRLIELLVAEGNRAQVRRFAASRTLCALDKPRHLFGDSNRKMG
jgi:hypothetical protein